jgi:L-fuculose-phosphate aldolase
MASEARLRAEIVRIAQAVEGAGFAPATSGNISCRHGDGLLITPSAMPYAEMRPADVVALDRHGAATAAQRAPKRRPSSEWRLHAAIYRARPDAGAIVHTHSPRATSLSCARRPIPAFHYMIALMGGSDIRCADYATFGTEALADSALRALDGRKAALLANHGVVAIGATLDGAFTVAAEVENLASQYLALLAAGLEPVVLDEAEMARVAAKFATYGKAG